MAEPAALAVSAVLAESAVPAEQAEPAEPAELSKISKKKRPKLDFSLRKGHRFCAQKTGPALIAHSIGGHRFGARILVPERGAQI